MNLIGEIHFNLKLLFTVSFDYLWIYKKNRAPIGVLFLYDIWIIFFSKDSVYTTEPT